MATKVKKTSLSMANKAFNELEKFKAGKSESSRKYVYDLVFDSVEDIENQNEDVRVIKSLIDSLDSTIAVVVGFDRNKDGKVSFGEGFAGAQAMLPIVMGAYADVKRLKEVWDGLSKDEVNILLAYAATKSFMPDSMANINEMISRSLNAAAYNHTYLTEMVRLAKS